MKLVVKNNNGDKFTLQIRPNETFLDLKRRVELESGISLDLRDITSNKRNINEQQKVIDYFLSEQNQVVQNAPVPEVVCAVPTCENKKSTHPDKTYFEFPDEDIRCHQWVLYCRRIATRLSADARSNLPVNVGAPGTAVCSDHFKADQFVKNTTTLLKRTAVPCINPELPSAAPTFNVNRRTGKDSKILSHNILQDSLSSSGNTTIKNSSPASYVCRTKPFGTSSIKLTCRLCALPARNTVFIYSKEGKNMMLAEKICVSLPIKVKMTDNLPKQVCRSCIERLDAAFHFVEICSSADDNYRKCDENKRKEIHDKEALGICPCCVDGQLSLLGDPLEGDLDVGTVPGTVLEELFPNQVHEQEVHQEQIAREHDNDTRMDTGEIVQPVESTGSEQGEYVLPDILDLEGSINGEEPFLCRICGAGMRTHGSACDHALSHGVDKFFQCILCENYYTGPEELVDHFQSHKPPVPFSSKEEEEEEDEDEDEDDDPGVFCEKCGEHFSSVLAIPDHKCKVVESELLSKKCALCPRAFASEHRLQFHMKYHTGSLKGDCTICGKSYPSEWKLYRHVVEEHEAAGIDEDLDLATCDEGVANCEECGKSLPSLVALKYHMKSHIKTDGSINKHLCEWCGKTFIRRSMLRNHVTTAHRQVQESSCFTCKICKEAFPTTRHAISHMDSAHNHFVENESAYSFEMITVSRLFLCEYCEKVFAEGNVLNKHRELHHSATSPNGATFMCKFCAGIFESFNELQEHKSSMHGKHDIPNEYKGEKPNVPVTYLCEFCDRVFVNYVKFMEHLTIHFGAEPYVCRICGVRFTSLDEVTEHRSIHGDVEPLDDIDLQRPFDCHYCDKTFAIEDALVKHIRMHTGEKPFRCEVCGKGFSQSSGLNTHKKVHSDIRPFSCHLCPRTFKIKGDRDVHIRKHSGQRPFKCEFCFKAFMTQHVYSQHRKIHTGERPYRCDVCHVAFRRSHVLTVHKRIHTGEKPNVCDICGKRYRQKGDMLKHRRSQHGLFPTRPTDFMNMENAESFQVDPLSTTDLVAAPDVAMTTVAEVVSPQAHFLSLN